MKYQSELIKEIVGARGHEMSSNHYESECVESWIKESKGAYPKLCDYQSEWLNYINEKPIGNFPYEIIADVTEATVNNVVPYAYKTAILKGQTLVNLVKQNEAKDRYITREAISNGFRYTQLYNSTSMSSTRLEWDEQAGANLFKTSTKYYIQCDIKVNKPRIIRAFSSPVTGTKFTYELQENESTRIKGTFVSGEEIDYIYLYVIPVQSLNIEDYVDDVFEVSNLIIVEEQEGMENWALPYFESMQSVKMPVLTTSNEDGTKTNILSTSEDVVLRGIGKVRDELDLLTGEVAQNIGEIVLDGSESWKEYTSQELTNTRLFYCEVPTNSNINSSKPTMINNRFASLNPNSGGLWDTDVVGLGHLVVKNVIRLRVLKSTANTINELKEELHSNPITVQYELAEKSIKTVD